MDNEIRNVECPYCHIIMIESEYYRHYMGCGTMSLENFNILMRLADISEKIENEITGKGLD